MATDLMRLTIGKDRAVYISRGGAILISVEALLVMCPHSNNFNDLFFTKYLIYKSVLNVYSARICAS